MKCPYCGDQESKVVDSRHSDDGLSIRRRRECLSCQKRFTTYETVESLPIIVVKKDGSRQSFDRNKVLNGMVRACEKRPVPLAALEQDVSEIEQILQNSLEREVRSETIGELVMERLKRLDEVSYVRFASVYRQFKDVHSFMDELNKFLEEKRGGGPHDSLENIQFFNFGDTPILPDSGVDLLAVSPQGAHMAPGLSVPPGPGQSGGLAVCAECGGPDLVWPGTGADRGICLGLSGHANLECGGPVSGGAHLDSGGGCPGAPVYDSNGSSACPPVWPTECVPPQ